MNNKRMILNIFWLVLGISLLVLSLMNIIDSALYSGFGGGLIAVGILQLIRNIKYRNNEEYREKMETEASDERNKFIRMKSWSWTGYIVLLTNAIGMVVAMILGQELLVKVLSGSLCFMVFTYWVCSLVLSRKY